MSQHAPPHAPLTRQSPNVMMNTPGMEVKPAVVSKQAEEVIHGVVTQVVCSAFTDHILVVVTQYGKIGTLVSVTPNMVTGDLERPTLTTKVLLGCDEPVVHVCAKNLVSFVSQESKNKPVLLGLALKDKSVDCVTAVKEVIKRCQVW
ncbi:hypothetical protein GDO81_016775 [Engystomops pustulosus]|uniref:Proteasome assembly chaperone 3 n=2 Tax=Engystomops pustulosus TaxID=76066 RepID=A0AAV7A9G3_ENGPU|nr:hypothetical protein GDO81_016775 [Engystomops pustulosus]